MSVVCILQYKSPFLDALLQVHSSRLPALCHSPINNAMSMTVVVSPYMHLNMLQGKFYLELRILINIRCSFDNSYITWVTDDKPVWTLMGAGMGADPAVEIGARAVPQEPMVNEPQSFLELSLTFVIVHHCQLGLVPEFRLYRFR